MGPSSKSHKSKDDKETQSQHLKIFNELDRLKMHREMMNNDPEKANLLKERKEERKKRKHHSLSRLKSDQKTNFGSSGYEWNTRSEAYKISVEPNDKEAGKFLNEPFGADSFVYRGNIVDDDKGSTSKMSCVLEKLRRSEYMGVFCLYVLFALSILAVFFIVFKSIPVLESEGPILVSKGTFGDNYKRTMEVLKQKRRNYGDHKRHTDNIPDAISRRMQGLNQFSGMDSDEDGLSETDIEESNKYLSSKLNIKNINEINNERLKSFFKKLSETDARIRCLKKKIEQENPSYTTNQRFKRSVRNRRRQGKRGDSENKKPIENESVDLNDDNYYLKAENDKPRLAIKIKGKKKNKRSANDSNALASVVIQHKKIEVQYKKNNGKFRKCSHLPTDTNSHEHVMKHPFYKNTQRFDDILDRFINKDFPEILDEDFQTLVKTGKGACKHENVSRDVDTVSGMNKDRTDADNKYDSQQTVTEKYGDIDGTTVSNEAPPKISYNHDLLNEVPKIRKLMQFDEATNENEEDDEADDEDDELDEITKDSVDTQGDASRKQREIPKYEDPLPNKHTIAPGILNPNWKGPMPLYSDEVNAMMSTTPETSSPSHEPKALAGDKESKDDLEYLEEYLSSNNHRLAEMAQAYSDYGVLSESKETKIDRMPGDKRNSKEVDGEAKTIVKRKDDKIEEEKDVVIDVFKTIATNSKNWVHQPVLVADEIMENNSSAIQTWGDLPTLMNTKEIILPITVPSTKLAGRSLKSLEDDSNLALNNQITEFEDSGDMELDNSLLNIKHIGRSLKSIDESNVNQYEDAKVNDAQIFKGDSNGTGSRRGKEADITNGSSIETMISSVLNETRGNEEIGPSHFMAMMSEWFWILSNLFSETTNNSTVPHNVSRSNNTVMPFPAYDSDMVDNIAHRSRVLLSLTDNTDNQTEIAKEHEIKPIDFNNEIQRNTKNASKNSKLESNATDSKENKIANYNDNNKLNDTKTVVKRSAVNENNLVFWNDLYDEEYGLQERIENPNRGSLKGKHEYKDSAQNLLTNSGRWLGDQYKRIADNLKYRLTPDKAKKREYRSVFGYQKPYQRLLKEAASSKHKEDQETVNPLPKHRSFAELSANMKHICQDAAKAVADTRKNAVKKETKEGAMTNTLMQQLVRLMTDVVDMQVHEKTCLKLPPDLANFLEWLTQPDPDSVPKKGNLIGNMLQTNTKMNDFEYLATEPNEFEIMTTPPSKYVENPTGDYLSIFQAIQDLQQQYEAMDDEEKNKMGETRNYLQNQVEYLNSILQSGFLLKKTVRKKKETKREKRKVNFPTNDFIDSIKLRTRRKFVKSFVKKHTQGTTPGSSDNANINPEELFKKDTNIENKETKQRAAKTSANKRIERFVEKLNDKDRRDNVDESEMDRVSEHYGAGKRNIYDVYYKAVEESKKMTTPKISAKIRVTDDKLKG